MNRTRSKPFDAPVVSGQRASAIFGAWLVYEPDLIGLMLGSNFMRFESLCGINGLAREKGFTLELLAVVATKPGTGQFREFIRDAQRGCDLITIWHERSEILAKALPRYGFRECMLRNDDGEMVSAWEWKWKEFM